MPSPSQEQSIIDGPQEGACILSAADILAGRDEDCTTHKHEAAEEPAQRACSRMGSARERLRYELSAAGLAEAMIKRKAELTLKATSGDIRATRKLKLMAQFDAIQKKRSERVS